MKTEYYYLCNLSIALGTLNIMSRDGSDTLTVRKAVAANLFIDAGAGDDSVYIFSLPGGNGTVLGGPGNDLLFLDGRDPDLNVVDSPLNTMDGSNLYWNGGGGDDTVEMYFVSAGTSNLNIVNDSDGVNRLIAKCTDQPSTILSRKTFLANIHHSDSMSLERINLDSVTASITSVLLYLNGGENKVHFDDTLAAMKVFGGNEQVSGNWSCNQSSAYDDLTHLLYF